MLGILSGAAIAGAAWPDRETLAQLTQAISDEFDIDPYFLDPGELDEDDEREIMQIEEFREREMAGRPAVRPRGLRSRRSPTYRFVHWSGDIGDPNGRFMSPLSIEAQQSTSDAYHVNGQILGFRCASDDFGRRADRGTLTVELRARVNDEPMTWLFCQQFDTDDQGFTNIGYEYVAQRDGAPNPAFSEDHNIGLRIQLMRAPRRGGQIFRKMLSSALVLSGVPLQLDDKNAQRALRSLPPLRVPALLQEGAALSQAVIGGTAEEVPIWRGGFSSFGLSSAGSSLSLAPGLWLAIDGERETDLRGVVLEDVGGTVAPTRDGELLDCNYLVVGLDMGEGRRPDYLARL
jgi:hypothetical protein